MVDLMLDDNFFDGPMDKLNLSYDLDFIQVTRYKQRNIIYKCSLKRPFRSEKRDAERTQVLVGHYKTSYDDLLNRNLIYSQIGTTNTSSVNKAIKDSVIAIKAPRLRRYTKQDFFNEIYAGTKKCGDIYLRAEFLKDPEKSELDIRYKLESAIRNAKNKYKYDRFTSIDDIYITYEVTKCKNDIQDSEGNHITKEQLISSVHVEVKTKTQGRWDIKYETASTCFNAPQGVEVLDKLDQIIDEAVNRSYAKIYAKELKTTNVNVLMDGSVASVFIHEIVGHLAEADSILAGDIFRDKYKQKIGPSFLTIKDVPFIENGFGNCIYDDEGVEGREVTLVKNGIVNDFLNDRTTAVKLNSYGYNVDLTGNGRANLSVPRPLPRMRNTILEPGTKSHEELLNELGTGIYLANTTGGKVNKKGGNFVIHIDEAYWVENGKIKYPVKVTHLAGNALIALNSIAALGDSSTLKTFSGVCGRSSDTRWCPIQHVYVSSRSPAILFSCLEIDGPKSSNYDEYITSDIIGKMLI